MRHMDFRLDGITYIVPPDRQTIEIGNKKCQPGIFLSEAQTTTAFGQTFMENFVTSYDYENGQVKLGVNLNVNERV